MPPLHFFHLELQNSFYLSFINSPQSQTRRLKSNFHFPTAIKVLIPVVLAVATPLPDYSK